MQFPQLIQAFCDSVNITLVTSTDMLTFALLPSMPWYFRGANIQVLKVVWSPEIHPGRRHLGKLYLLVDLVERLTLLARLSWEQNNQTRHGLGRIASAGIDNCLAHRPHLTSLSLFKQWAGSVSNWNHRSIISEVRFDVLWSSLMKQTIFWELMWSVDGKFLFRIIRCVFGSVTFFTVKSINDVWRLHDIQIMLLTHRIPLVKFCNIIYQQTVTSPVDSWPM